MKILFVNHIPGSFVKDKEPLGLMSLSAVLKQHGHEVRLCLPHMHEVQKILKEFPAQIVGYSITTGYHNFYLEFNDALRQTNNNILSVFGGPHPTFMPDFIEHSDNIDAICRGEGDFSFVEFVDRFASKADYHLTPNFYVRREGKIYKNETLDLVGNLDELPFPDRELIYDSYPSAAKSKVKNFLTLRGCPYNCSHCFNHCYNELYRGKGKILRRRSVENVIDEILDVSAKYPLELVYFRDDNFVLFPEWLEEFCLQYKKRIDIPFVCTSRLDLITDKMAKQMRQANCKSVEVGIEFGNDHIREDVLRRNMTRQQILNGTKIFKANKIRVLAENMIGIPSSTLENELETYSLNKQCSVYYANSSMLQPYFGTDIYKYSQKLKLIAKEVDDISPEAYLRGKSLLQLGNEKQRERLNKIMALSVRLRLPVWLVKFLIYLPLKPVYSIIHVLFKGYSGSKLYPFKTTLNEKVKIVAQLFRQHHVFSKPKSTKG